MTPDPPYFIISVQQLQILQSSDLHPLHFMHFTLFLRVPLTTFLLRPPSGISFFFFLDFKILRASADDVADGWIRGVSDAIIFGGLLLVARTGFGSGEPFAYLFSIHLVHSQALLRNLQAFPMPHPDSLVHFMCIISKQ